MKYLHQYQMCPEWKSFLTSSMPWERVVANADALCRCPEPSSTYVIYSVIWSAIVYDSALMFQLCKYCRPAMMVSGAYNAVWACKKFR